MPDIELSNLRDIDRRTRISQATKSGRASFKGNVPTSSDLDEGIPQYAVSKSTGQMYQFIKVNGQMYHSVLEKGEIAELDIEII